jgi:hypothetical protein
LSDFLDLAHFPQKMLVTKTKKRNLTTVERLQAVAMLVQSMGKDGRFGRGCLKKIREHFGVTRQLIWRLWRRAESARAGGIIEESEIISRKNLCGRRPIYFKEPMADAIRNTPLLKRRSQRKLACHLGVSAATIQRFVKNGFLRVHSNTLKPFLTEENMVKRLLYALECVDPLQPTRYRDMYDVIHMDEKWFYISREKERFLLLDDEEDDPYRAVSHKSHIKKVMFLCAVARPRYDNTRNAWFDGKLGMWPVGKFVPAQKNSVNRAKGTMEWKNVNMTQDLYRTMMMDELIPALLTRWPRGNNQTIRIQHDGAKAHIKDDDEWFNEALDEVGLNAKLYTQPANSPDTNILDLGFFRAIQSANDEVSTNEAELITHVQQSYENFPRQKLNYTWLTLQSCLNEIIECHGSNNYKIPHYNKQRMETNGELPVSLEVTERIQELLGEAQEEEEDNDNNYN